MSYEFIEPLTERPRVEKKVKCLAEQIIKEFQDSKVEYAKVSFANIKHYYKSPAFCARAIGRVLKRLDLKGEITVYSDKENVYLERSKR
ncbi:MAG: hypothetical protein ACE5NN_00900 [Candidatus Bathyarchaeia archaeon]